MLRFVFVLAAIFILILFSQKLRVRLKLSQLKKKIKNNPLIGSKEDGNRYSYREAGYTLSYTIQGSPGSTKSVEWLSLKRRLTFPEEKILKIKRDTNKFFLYQRWAVLFRPAVIIILAISLLIFYFGIKGHALKRAEYFKFVVAKMTGVSPESIEYNAGGWFKVSGKRRSLRGDVEPVTVSFNPLLGLFSPNAAKVSFWSKGANKYVDYSVSVNEQGDIWLKKGKSRVHGSLSGEKLVWDKSQRAGIRDEVSGHRILVEDGKLKIFDE